VPEEKEEERKYERVLVVSAHPDDPEFGFGATVAKLTSDGADVRYVIVTDGSQGGEDPSVPDAELTATRYEEQRAAARVLGVTEVVFLGFKDGHLAADIPLRKAIAAALGYQMRRRFDAAIVRGALLGDKKRHKGRQRWILPMAIGRVIEVDDVRVITDALRVIDADQPAGGADRAGVPDLTAALRVERRRVEEDPDLLPFLGRGELGLIRIDQRGDPGVKSVLRGVNLANRLGKFFLL